MSFNSGARNFESWWGERSSGAIRDAGCFAPAVAARRFLSCLSIALLACASTGCNSDAAGGKNGGGLLVVVDSDLSIPKDIDHVAVDVTQSGKTLLHVDRDLGAGELKLPASLLVGPTGNARPVLVHGVASKDGTPRIERSAVTAVPTSYVGEIHLPFDYLCDGTADADGESTCPGGQTCKLGTCNATTVPPSDVTRAPSSAGAAPGAFVSVDGGAIDADGGAGNCFDVVACMQGQPTVPVEASGCTLPVPSGTPGDHLNVAILLSGGGEGICSPDQKACWVVLDQGSNGWTSDGTTITLPAGVCQGGQTPSIAVSNACRSKQSTTPVCGDWSVGTVPIDRPPPPLGEACDGALSRPCGRCGTQTRTCNDGVLSTFTACQGEGTCAPSDSQGCATTGATETCAADCTWGACQCPKGKMECDGACVPEDDVHDCGTCGHDCTSLSHVSGKATCGAGKCGFDAAACAAGWGDCDGDADNGCETDLTAAGHCGACGRACSGTKDKCAQTDGAYDCVSSCPSAAPEQCDTSCVDTAGDPNNCGACDAACPAIAHGQPACTSGICGTTCNSGYSSCGGTCIDLTSDVSHCGSCTNACGAGKSCNAGQCVCPSGLHDCSGTCVSNSAVATCGTACSSCVAPAGGTATCDGTRCVTTCGAGLILCGGTCSNVTTDAANCGACGTACTGGKVCVAGGCACPAGKHDCSGTCADNTSPQTCGASCSPCPPPKSGVATCDGTSCIPACAGGLSLCSNACVNEQTDAANCGGCKNTCIAGSKCQAGKCACSGPSTQPCGNCNTGAQTRTCNADGSWTTYGTCVGGGACAPGATAACTNGTETCSAACVFGACACAAGYTSCSGACVDLTTSSGNCGQCGRVCSSYCVASSCKTVAALAASNQYMCALLTDQTVWCWGQGPAGSSTSPTAVPGVSGAVAISAGNSHSCALLSNGTVECWGDNGEGQLGNGSTTSSTSPVGVSGLGGVIAVSAGYNETCALLSDGTAWCWGQNFYGLGDDNQTGQSTTPIAVSGISGATAIAVGDQHACAILGDGTVRCWGAGLPNSTTSATPVSVGLSNVTSIAVGGQTCAALSDGTAWCWGFLANINGVSSGFSDVEQVPGLSGVTATSTNFETSCALLSNGTVQCWGANDYFQLGTGSPTPLVSVNPVAVSGLKTAVAIARNARTTCSLLSTGTLKCWGMNNVGELGIGSTGGPVSCGSYRCAGTPIDVVW